MLIEPYTIRPLNSHYDGEYDASAMQWRVIAAADKARNISQFLVSRQVEKVLEVGCGTGAVLAEIRRLGIGRHHVGIDMIDPARNIAPGAEDLELRQYDGSALPFADNSFDLVYASHVVEHVTNPRAFIQELSRVSANLVYLEVPCEVRIRMKRSILQSALHTGHINGYTPEYFLILLQTSGLNVVDIRLFDHSLDVQSFGTSRFNGRMKKLLRGTALKLHPILASRLFCYHCGALATKARAARAEAQFANAI